MSLNMPPSINLSNVQASAKSCPGGGGNTGYFSRNSEEEEENQFRTKDYPDDSFEKQDVLQEIQNESFFMIFRNLILDLVDFIKGLFIGNTNN